MDRPKKEMDDLVKVMKSGKKLVLQCSNKGKWWPWNKASYQKKLEQLDELIRRFFCIDMPALLDRDVLELTLEFREFCDEIRSTAIGVPRNQTVEYLRGVVCSPPYLPPAFTFGLDGCSFD